MACLDTSFLIDLMREQRKRRAGPATQKLKELDRREERLGTTLFTVGELYAGLRNAKDIATESESLDAMFSSLEIFTFDVTTAKLFGALYGDLRKSGADIGVMDALISSVAIESDQIVITKNIAHFSRVPHLKVEGY